MMRFQSRAVTPHTLTLLRKPVTNAFGSKNPSSTTLKLPSDANK